MKKKWLLLAGVMLIAAAAVSFARPKAVCKRPFADLKAEDIESAAVQLLPPDRTVEVTDFAQLAEALNAVVIYRKDNSYKESCGQAVIYTVALKDGRQFTVNAYNPFLVIDGIGYRTEYEPCERLSQIANDLLDAQ